jgi:hypothetical protein
VQGQPVADRPHAVLTNPEADVAAGLGCGQVPSTLDVGQVGLGQVGRPAYQVRQVGRDGVDGLLGRLAGGLLGRLGERLVQLGVPAGRQLAGQRGPELAGQARLALTQGGQSALPGHPLLPVGGDPDLPALRHPLGHLEVLVGVPAVDLLGRPDLVLT